MNSPQTMTEKMISGSDLTNPSTKITLLFHHALVNEQSQTDTKTRPRKLAVTLTGNNSEIISHQPQDPTFWNIFNL